VDEEQRRDVLRRAEDDVRRAGREFGWDSSEACALRQRQLGLERSTAAELGLPYAERVRLGVSWDADTPMPVLLSGLRTFVAFHQGAGVWADHGIAIVEFKRVASIKIGSLSHEVLRRHSLFGSGLEIHSAHEVRNSPWITELTELNRGYERFDERIWRGKRHFVLTFYDATLECVANRTIIRTAPGGTMPEVLAGLGAEAL
jgi:hypothetical protein